MSPLNPYIVSMNLDQLDQFRRAAIKALVSDDELLDKLILKGGNALDMIHKIAERASFDLDFSIVDSFDDAQLDKMENRMQKLLTDSFREISYHVLDVNLVKKPSNILPELESFWGGYKLEFKILSLEKYDTLKSDIEQMRRNAIPVASGGSTKMRIEISRFEYCPLIEERDIDGYIVKVYSPLLIAIEKLRAICQQMDEYKNISMTSKSTPRARDFFDIYSIAMACDIDIGSAENQELIQSVFGAKKVPLDFLKKIERYREFHAQDFVSVKDTVKPTVNLQSFDFYFDFVLNICKKLHP